MKEEELKHEFGRYVTVPDGKYPLIKVINRYDRRTQKQQKVAYITFSPNSMDGQTAAFMSFDFTTYHEQHGKTKLHFKNPRERINPC